MLQGPLLPLRVSSHVALATQAKLPQALVAIRVLFARLVLSPGSGKTCALTALRVGQRKVVARLRVWIVTLASSPILMLLSTASDVRRVITR